MVWYTKCEYCGKTEKYGPSWKCVEKRRDTLLQKITGSLVMSVFTRSEYHVHTFLYTMYKKGDSIFWVRTVLTNGSDEWYIDETIKEVPDPPMTLVRKMLMIVRKKTRIEM